MSMKKLLILTILGSAALGYVSVVRQNDSIVKPAIAPYSGKKLVFVMPHHRPENQQASVTPHRPGQNLG